MIGALLTALFFGVTPVCANQAIRRIGFVRANAGRLVLAALVLGLWAFAFGQGLSGPLWWFFGAGAVGFGLGGMCMFLALPRLGAPLSSLMVESLAAVFAAVLAWAWYGDAVAAPRLFWAALVLAGVSVGLWPYIKGGARASGASSGVSLGALWAVLAGLGQAVSIVVSRKALLSMKLAGTPVSLPTASFQRLLGGLCAALAVGLLLRWLSRSARARKAAPGAAGSGAGRGVAPFSASGLAPGPAWMWVGLNALFGPILGVTCLIWALKTMQPGLAQAIAATAPLVCAPFSLWIDRHSPPGLYYLGCLLAIAGLTGVYLTG